MSSARSKGRMPVEYKLATNRRQKPVNTNSKRTSFNLLLVMPRSCCLKYTEIYSCSLNVDEVHLTL